MAEPAGLYVHIPFCQEKCEYCDFYSITKLDQIQQFVDAVLKEIQLRAPNFQDTTFSTIFWGGGTPSLLSHEQISAIWQTLHDHYSIASDGEFSIETNPGTLSPDKLQHIRESGFNRLSMGVQSFNPEELKSLGRIHSVEEVLINFENARTAGFNNINIDLMTAFPGISETSFRHSLDVATGLSPEHISCYTLIFEPNTILYKRMQLGEVSPLSEDEEAKYYLLAADVLGKHGYVQYEVSNFAKGEARTCRHNLIYWRHHPYIGFGPSAHSFYDNRRFSNKRSLMYYIRSLNDGQLPIDFSEELSADDLKFEYIFLNLRLREGVSLKEFQYRFASDLLEEHQQTIERLLADNLLQVQDDHLRLTESGWMIADTVAAHF